MIEYSTSNRIDSQNDENGPRRLALYASMGPKLVHYDIDVNEASLVKRDMVTVAADVHYACTNHSRSFLYVASGEKGSASSDSKHHVSAFRIDPSSGALKPHGHAVPLPYRPIHITTDMSAQHILITYSIPSTFIVIRINPDGTIGEEVKQEETLDTGIFAHEIFVAPSNKMAVLVTRGNDATKDNAEDPGALKIFSYKNGVLKNKASVAPDGGFGFGPRNLSLHPVQPWLFLSLERQNKLYVFRLEEDFLSPMPMFIRETLSAPMNVRPRQLAGTISIHPNGRFLYACNRADATTDSDGQKIFAGGENNIAVYSINEDSGEPKLIQSVDTRGIYPRTFALDPSGRLLIVANQKSRLVKKGQLLEIIPPSLSFFRIDDKGKLDYVRKYDVEGGDEMMFWMGMV